jgi:hypothetical protein
MLLEELMLDKSVAALTWETDLEFSTVIPA